MKRKRIPRTQKVVRGPTANVVTLWKPRTKEQKKQSETVAAMRTLVRYRLMAQRAVVQRAQDDLNRQLVILKDLEAMFQTAWGEIQVRR